MYGRVYKIVDCDKFTRHFLNRMGIPVPDPIDLPRDPYANARREKDVSALQAKKRIDQIILDQRSIAGHTFICYIQLTF